MARLYKYNDILINMVFLFKSDADIMEELKGLTPGQMKALIALVKNSWNLGETRENGLKNLGGIGFVGINVIFVSE